MTLIRKDLERIFESLPGLYLILKPDAPRFTIIAVSNAYLEATLTNRADIIGKALFDVFPDNPKDPNATGTANLKKSLEKVLRFKKPHRMATQKYDIPHPRGGFEERYWEPLNSPVLNDQGEISYIVHCVTDVTKAAKQTARQEQSEQEITWLKQRHNSIFEQDYVAIAVLRGEDYIIEQANPLVYRIWGRTQKQVLGKPLLKVLPEIEGQGIAELLAHVLHTGEHFIGREMPVHLKRRRGTLETIYFNFAYVPMRDTANRITGISVLATDSSEQVKTRKRVEESEAQLRFLAESMPQKIFTANPRGDVEYLSPQWAEYTGLSQAKIKKEGWAKLVHPEDVEEDVRRWRQALATGEPFEMEHRFRRRDGAYRWHLCRAQAMRNSEGKITMWVGSLTDIEDVKRTQELERTTQALKEQRTQLVALNNAKDEFISLASHQLRTPATGVKQYIGLLLGGYAGETSAVQREFLTSANESNERQLKIVNDLLRVAQADAGRVKLHKTKTNLVTLIAEVLEEHATKFSERKQKASFVPQFPTIEATVDKAMLRMVLENLIDNASKYTYPGKKIQVSVKVIQDTVRIAVCDQGAGIHEKDMGKLFQKFSRLDNPLSLSAGGSGLGLYWVKKIVDLHGGKIMVSSIPNEGSTFTVALPL